MQPPGPNHFNRGRGYGRGDRELHGGSNPRFLTGRGEQSYGRPQFGDGPPFRENFTPRGGYRGREQQMGQSVRPPTHEGNTFNRDRQFGEPNNLSRGQNRPPFSNTPNRGFGNFSRPPRGAAFTDSRRGSYGRGTPHLHEEADNNRLDDRSQYRQSMDMPNERNIEEGSFVQHKPDPWQSSGSSFHQNRTESQNNEIPGTSGIRTYQPYNESNHIEKFQR